MHSSSHNENSEQRLCQRDHGYLVLRALAEYATHARFSDRFDPALLCPALGLGDDTLRECKPSEIKNILADRLVETPCFGPAELVAGFAYLPELADRLYLDQVEQALLVILIWLNTDSWWSEFSYQLGELDRSRACHILARILSIETVLVRKALHPAARLFQTGLLEYPRHTTNRLADLYPTLAGLDEGVLQCAEEWQHLVSSHFTRCTNQEQRHTDFSFLSEKITLIEHILKGTLQHKTKGVHILLYGPPGTGKTTLAHQLADTMGAKLYAIKTADNEGDELSGLQRFRSFRLGQHLLGQDGNTLMLFDEFEDLLPAHAGLFVRDSGAFYKGWINAILEQASIPTIWTCNDITSIDPAHLRRLTYVLEVTAPPRHIKKRLLEHYLKSRPVSEEWLSRMADCNALTPSRIQQLGQVAQLTSLKETSLEVKLETLLRDNLHAINVALPRKKRLDNEIDYKLDYINSDHDLARIIDGLGQTREGRLCLYGQPGTGKTAFVRHLAQRLGKPLLCKQGSDILSMWMGETEKNIATMFRQAEKENAILLIDEADSFLQNRQHAQRSWEITQVNELLVQMENFESIFIASTNLVDTLDAASLRRFDLKINFNYMTTQQSWMLFTNLLELDVNNLDQYLMDIKKRVSRLDNLTPGDFATVIRKMTVLNRSFDPELLLSELTKESHMKPGGNRNPIGFIK